ncbi:MAG TPA: DegV family protein [Clostridiales bacterium]|nr:DegV family protein [Clostridiales bacterium]
MNKIKIITDSVSDLPKNLVEKYDIKIMPLKVIIDGKVYRDWYDLTQEEFLKKLAQSKEMPKTTQVTPEEFMEAYEQEVRQGNTIISIHISSKCSGTYQSALLAKEEIVSKYLHAKIHVIDSKLLSLSYGIMAVEAARMAEANIPVEKILERLHYMTQKMGCIFVVDTLEYLKRGGRLSATKAAIGSLLNIKPVINMKDGELYVFDKIRGNKKVIPKLLQYLDDLAGEDLENQTIGICHNISEEKLADYVAKIKERFNPKEIITSHYGSVVATHGGPGIISALFMATKQKNAR